jgi:hypothetical protein
MRKFALKMCCDDLHNKDMAIGILEATRSGIDVK